MDRYAIYYTPEPGSPLARFGARWLGHDPAADPAGSGQPANVSHTPESAESPAAQALLDVQDRITQTPRRYGLHATLKAPFRLKEGRSLSDLMDAMAAFAGRTAPAEGPALKVTQHHGFLALCPDGPCPQINRLAASVVTAFEPIRAALTPGEVARRQPERLSQRQRELLDLYGYPFVLEEFAIHLTLTGRLDPDRDPVEALTAHLTAETAPVIAAPFCIDALTLMGDPGEGAPFRTLQRFQLTGNG